MAGRLEPRKLNSRVLHKQHSAIVCGDVAAKYFVSVEWGSRMLREACQPGMPDLQLAHSLFTNMVGAKRVPLSPVMAIYADALRAQEPGSDRIEQVSWLGTSWLEWFEPETRIPEPLCLPTHLRAPAPEVSCG
jgi:hypothetical protein